MTTVCVQNTFSWFEAREVSNNYLWTGDNTKGEYPTKRPAIVLSLTLNKDGQLEALQFSDMEKLTVTNNENGGVISFESVEKITEFLQRLFSFTGTSSCLVSPDLDLNRVRDLLYNLEIQLSAPALEESGTAEDSSEKKGKSICMVHVITCGCNMGHCAAVCGWQKAGPFKTIREIFRGFDSGESDSELLDEFCGGFFKPEEKDVEKRVRHSFLNRDPSMLLLEEEQSIYRRIEIFVEAKMKDRWFEYPGYVFLYVRPLEKTPTLDPPCYGVRTPDIPTDELDPENEVYIQFNYGR